MTPPSKTPGDLPRRIRRLFLRQVRQRIMQRAAQPPEPEPCPHCGSRGGHEDDCEDMIDTPIIDCTPEPPP